MHLRNYCRENMINDRIRDLIKYFADGNKRKFSQLTNLSPSVVENLVGTRQGKPSFEVLEKIICAFANINTDWLITGRGEMLLDDNKHFIEPAKMSETAVPFYDIPVSAGALGVLTYSKDAMQPDGYIDMEVFRRCEAILPVIGVSMEPEIHSGDLIGIKRLNNYNWSYIQTGKVYMIITHEERMIKYITKADDPDFIVCSSPNYHDFRVLKSDILEIYRVLANIRAF